MCRDHLIFGKWKEECAAIGAVKVWLRTRAASPARINARVESERNARLEAKLVTIEAVEIRQLSRTAVYSLSDPC